MSALFVPRARPLPRPVPHVSRHGTELHRTLGGWIWFVLMIGGWSAFFGLLLFSEPRLAELWAELRDLPLLVEGLVWLMLFPLVLATAVWESSWDDPLRFALVCAFALAWSTMFFPRKRTAK
jgi:hypothetical protein